MRKAASSSPPKMDHPLSLSLLPPPHSLTFPPRGNQAERLVQNRWLDAPPPPQAQQAFLKSRGAHPSPFSSTVTGGSCRLHRVKALVAALVAACVSLPLFLRHVSSKRSIGNGVKVAELNNRSLEWTGRKVPGDTSLRRAASGRSRRPQFGLQTREPAGPRSGAARAGAEFAWTQAAFTWRCPGCSRSARCCNASSRSC